MTPLIGDLIESTVGKVVTGLVGKYLPASMSEGERAQLVLKAQELTTEELKLAAASIESVNATMREEAKSDKWWQSSWRPFVGYTFSLVIINNYIFLPYFASWGLLPVEIPGGIWQAMLIILGVAAGTRGIEKWQREKNS